MIETVVRYTLVVFVASIIIREMKTNRTRFLSLKSFWFPLVLAYISASRKIGTVYAPSQAVLLLIVVFNIIDIVFENGIVLCTVEGIAYATLLKWIFDHFGWNGIPCFFDPLSNQINLGPHQIPAFCQLGCARTHPFGPHRVACLWMAYWDTHQAAEGRMLGPHLVWRPTLFSIFFAAFSHLQFYGP